MKRMISFLLVLAITLASFACTTKPKPDPFTPLQNELITATFTENLDQPIKINWVHDEINTALNVETWTKKDDVLGSGGILNV
jgi:hypothetical protein